MPCSYGSGAQAQPRAPLAGSRAPASFSPMARRWTLLILSIASSACGDDPTEPAGPDLSHLSLYPTRYVTVVGYGVELVVTARDLEGTELAGFVPSYTSSNSAVVRIGADRTITAVGPGTTTVRGSAGGQTAEVTVYVGAASYDLETLGPPRVLTSNYIDLSRIERISRFRSAIGHHYAFSPDEPCRSMKHYYQPLLESDWTTVDIYAPATGMVGLTSEGSDYKVSVLPREMPWLQVVIFHVNPDPHIVRGAWVEAGDHVGKHARQNTMSDIAMSLGPVEEGRLLSYFETMTDDVFAEYQARGVASREAATITKAERDADPVPCQAQSAFPEQGTIENWLYLN